MLHSPPPSIALGALQNWTKCYTGTASVFHKIEQKWMCQSHGILQLPCSLFRIVLLPLHLYLPYGLVSEHCDRPVEDAHWLDLELSLGFHLNHVPIYHMLRVMYIYLLRKETWKKLWALVLVGNASLYATGHMLSSTSKGPQYLGDILTQLPSFKELFLGFTLR